MSVSTNKPGVAVLALHNMAAPLTRADADEAQKTSVKVRLISKSAGKCDFGERLCGRGHHEFGALDASPGDIHHGRRPH